MGKIEDNEVIKALKILNQYCNYNLIYNACGDCIIDNAGACMTNNPSNWNIKEIDNGQ